MTKSEHNFNSLYHIILYQIYQLIKRKNKKKKKKKKKKNKRGYIQIHDNLQVARNI